MVFKKKEGMNEVKIHPFNMQQLASTEAMGVHTKCFSDVPCNRLGIHGNLADNIEVIPFVQTQKSKILDIYNTAGHRIDGTSAKLDFANGTQVESCLFNPAHVPGLCSQKSPTALDRMSLQPNL